MKLQILELSFKLLFVAADSDASEEFKKLFLCSAGYFKYATSLGLNGSSFKVRDRARLFKALVFGSEINSADIESYKIEDIGIAVKGLIDDKRIDFSLQLSTQE